MTRSNLMRLLRSALRASLAITSGTGIILCLLVSSPAWAAGPDRPDLDLSELRSLAIEEGGRVKPLDTFARETVLSVTGQEPFRRYDSLDLMLSWMVFPEVWEKEAILWVADREFEKDLGLAKGVHHISAMDLSESSVFRSEFARARQLQERDERLGKREKAVISLLNRFNALDRIRSGEALTIVPERETGWGSIVGSLGGAVHRDFVGLLTSYSENDVQGFNNHARSLKGELENWEGASYPQSRVIQREVRYNQIRPFQRAVYLYLLAAFAFWMLVFRRGRASEIVSFTLFSAGFLLHTWGIVTRCLIAGRPPVSNMYESVIWVAWGVCLFATIFWGIYRNRTFLIAASLVAACALFLADVSPSTVDPGIHPLVPVLRSNKWLTIHVLTITLSYAAFALALGIGHLYLFQHILGRKLRDPDMKQLIVFLYRSLQVGIILLASGTILGGVWANYSWGRFWGWDPKEVWALIALLGYLAILHGKLAGWLGDFGMAVGSIVSFMGVIMAWYGVNFVLGAGLHSYGFGAGGVFWVLVYILAELVFIGVAFLHRRGLKTT